MKKRYLIAGAYGTAGAALALKLWSRPRDLAWEDHAATLHHAEHSRLAMVDGVRVHYQEAGEPDAPVIVLIHGFCASNFVWREVLLPLAAAGFRVVAPDLVGFGFTEKPRDGAHGEYTIAAQAEMIVRLLETLEIDKATLIGSSYGGAVASFVALDHKEKVERLVLVSAVTNDDVKNQFLLRLAAVPVMGDLLSPLMLGSGRLMRWRMRKVYEKGGGPVRTEENMRAHHRPLRYAHTHRAVLRTLRRWDATRIEREAARITHPTLLLWGEGDTDVPLKNGFHLRTLLPNSRLIVFRQCGHLPQEEHPREFLEVVTSFCHDALAAPPSTSDTEKAGALDAGSVATGNLEAARA